MSIKDTIHQRMTAAMKSHDAEKVGALRYLLSQLKNQEISLLRPSTNEEEIKLLQSEAKKRKEAIEAYQKGNRPELAQKEQKELAIIQEFLPKQLSDEEIKKVIQQVINDLPSEALAKEGFGSVMKQTMSCLRGQADGPRVSALVRSIL